MSAKLFRITTIPLSLDILLTNQMKYMKDNGFQVIMISADGEEKSRLVEREECTHIVVPFTRKISPIQDIKCLLQLIRLCLKEKPDIIHTHTPKAGLLGMIAAKLCGAKLKIHTIAGLPLMTATGNKRKLLNFTERLTYWAADYVLPNSNSIMSFVKEHRFTRNDKLDIIGQGSSNGIDLKRFSNENISKIQFIRVRNAINYNSNYKYILSVGRVVKDKGILELVNAFLTVNKKRSNIKLVLVGPLEEERKEELLPLEILNEIKKNQDIIHVNWSDNVEHYMAIADLLIHASHREGFPNVPLQAGAMECPIICSKISGNIDIVTDKQTGVYFEVGNTIDLVDKIHYALDNYLEMGRYAKILRKQIEEKFSREYIHQELLKFYQEKLTLIE